MVVCDVELADARDQRGRMLGPPPSALRSGAGCFADAALQHCASSTAWAPACPPRTPSGPCALGREAWPAITGLAHAASCPVPFRTGMPDGYRTVIGLLACVARRTRIQARGRRARP